MAQKFPQKVKTSEHSYKLITLRENGSIRVQHFNHDDSKVDDTFAEELDPNNVMRAYSDSNKKRIPDLSAYPSNGLFGDFTGIPNSLHEATLLVQQSQQYFDSLPSNIRERFFNDPQKLHDFVHDPKNYDEALQLGMIDPSKMPKLNDNSNDELPKATKKAQSLKTPIPSSSKTPDEE